MEVNYYFFCNLIATVMTQNISEKDLSLCSNK